MNTSSPKWLSPEWMYLQFETFRQRKLKERREEKLRQKSFTQLNKKEQCCICLSTCCAAVVCVLLLSGLFLYVTWLYPPCPYTLGRQCNGHGACVNGVCFCDPLFSGAGCTDNQIPFYDINSDTVCSGHGVTNFPNITVECLQIMVGFERVGEGWSSVQCNAYVKQIREQLQLNGNRADLVPLSYTIPLCGCLAGYSGYGCEQSPCPLDENGAICGGHGNTTVGLVSNYTSAGFGCQCQSLFVWDMSIFDQTQLEIIDKYYYAEFRTKLYCGHVEQMAEGAYVVYTLPSDYKCYCVDDWTGTACTEGKCPIFQGKVCSGHGHPSYGQGLISNVSQQYIPQERRKDCQIMCADEETPCGKNKCAPVSALVNRGNYCNNGPPLSEHLPVRHPSPMSFRELCRH